PDTQPDRHRTPRPRMPIPEREPAREPALARHGHESGPIGHHLPGYRADVAVEVDEDLAEEDGERRLLRDVGPHPARRRVLQDRAVELREPE
ncbi:MAG: hypothetical protein Q9191_005465, partial [Dirinaria sp. TL-2023a]